MSFTRNLYPTKALLPVTVRATSRWQGGGAAADCTRIAGRGVSTVTYNAATGAYKITFSHVGEVFLGGTISVNATAGTTATARVVNTTAYSSTNKTLTIFVVDTATPTAKDLATTEELWIDVSWADTDGPAAG